MYGVDLPGPMRGMVLGPADNGDKTRIYVEFESPGGRWNLRPTEISRGRPDADQELAGGYTASIEHKYSNSYHDAAR